MIQERSDIEKAYASNLRKWSQRWNAFHESLCTEAEQRADLHLNVANNLTESVQSSVKSWQKANFHKTSISSTIKEVRALEAEFEAAQKVWYKRFKAVNRAQKEYYHACKTVGSLQVQVQNARNDPSGTPEQQSHQKDKLRKIEEKLTKAEQDKVKTREAYNHALNNLTDENMHYIDEMTKVFEKSQKSEKERLDFFKTQAFAMHKFLDLSKMPQLAEIYAKLEQTINLADSEADLKQWSFSHGVDMPTNFPQFEEYSPELAPLGHKKRSAISDSNPGVTLTGVTSAPSSQMPKLPDESPSHSFKYSSASGVASTFPNSNLESHGKQPSSDDSSAGATAPPVVPYSDPLYDDGKPGITVRALYDYQGVEDDELTFVTGDLFEKLEDEDEQGWCKGRKNGRVGLYPANYVEVV
ncbi:Protein kinase C and casein kinase substrate in neurons [Sparganum proliferum]